MRTKRHIRLGQITALISFLLGTTIFGLYYLTSDSNLLFVGYGFIVLIGLVNIGIFNSILLKALNDKENRKSFLRTGIIMLLNIPIMILYCGIAMILIETMRITFTNQTGKEITDIKIIGCGGGHIDNLEVGESETVWVSITGDCSISIEYVFDGQRKVEQVAGYVTSGMGQKLNHRIDGKDKDIFFEQ